MGGLFSAPKPVAIAAPTPEPAATTIAPPETAAGDARAAAAARARRGLAGTIATSARGVLDPLPALAGARKSLLGE